MASSGLHPSVVAEVEQIARRELHAILHRLRHDGGGPASSGAGEDSGSFAGGLVEDGSAGAGIGAGDGGASAGTGAQDGSAGAGLGAEDGSSGSSGSGGDSMTPSYLTLDAAGNVGASFTGNVHAQGLDLDAGTTTTPPTVDRVRWLRTSDGALVADLFGYNPGTGAGGDLDLQASDPDAAAAADLLLTAQHAINGAGATLQLNSGLDLATFQWGSDGRSSFLQLDGALAKRRIAFGTTTLTWTAATKSANVNIAGLGFTPTEVLTTFADLSSTQVFVAYSGNYIVGGFTLNGVTTAAVSTSKLVAWVAIG